MKPLGSLLLTGMAMCVMLASMRSIAQSKAVLDAGVIETVKQFNLLDRRHEHLENTAVGMLIFPQVTKGGIALASEYGEGVLQINGETVDYYSVASASVGVTAGLATHSEIILFMTPDALYKFMKSKGWSVGAETGIALLSKGAADEYALALKKPVLAFAFAEKGLIADLSLQGSKINKIAK